MYLKGMPESLKTSDIENSDTVKPALVTTCLQQAHYSVSLEKNGFSLKHVLKEPVYKDHFLCFLWAVAVDRFDCTSSHSQKDF